MFSLSRLQTLIQIAAAAAMLALPAAAQEFKAGDLTIAQPWMRATPAGAKTAAGYAKIINNGKEADTLIGGSAEGAGMVEVHEMKVENNVMKMHEVKGGLEIKPGATVELKPGSFHLMLMKLKGPYKEGQIVKGTLAFKRAGKVDVEFKVEAVGAKMDHGSGMMMNMGSDKKEAH